MAELLEDFLYYATSPLDAFKAVRHGEGYKGEVLGVGERFMLAFALVVSLFLLYWLFMIFISNTLGRLNVALPGIYVGPKSGFQGGNFATGGRAPQWEGGSMSDQANLSIDPSYANSTLAGDTAWVGCPGGSDVSLGGAALGEATRGQIMQSLPSSSPSCSASRLSDEAILSLSQWQ